MFKKIDYHTTTNIWLSLEDYSNAGLTQEKIIDIIKKISDPYSSLNLRAKPMGLNNNLIVESSCPSDKAYEIVSEIVSEIELELVRMKK